jgi:hypothetical protein
MSPMNLLSITQFYQETLALLKEAKTLSQLKALNYIKDSLSYYSFLISKKIIFFERFQSDIFKAIL